MATITLKPDNRHSVGATPWGNSHVLQFTLRTDATGKVLNSDGAAPAASGDVVRLGRLPAGSVLADWQAVVSKAVTGLSGKLGFAYVDGQDDDKVPQDDEYFADALALSAAARVRATNTKQPVQLPREAWLVLTATAGATGEGRADILVTLASEGAL